MGRRSGERPPIMGTALQLLVELDHDAIRATTELRWNPATASFALASWLNVLMGRWRDAWRAYSVADAT